VIGRSCPLHRYRAYGIVARGRGLKQSQAALFASIQQRYGVPPGPLIAIWGMETGFGSQRGNQNMLSLMRASSKGRRAGTPGRCRRSYQRRPPRPERHRAADRRATRRARSRACGSARSLIQPCSSHSRMAPASSRTDLAHPSIVLKAGRRSFPVTASNGIVLSSPYTPLAIMTASPIASVRVFEPVRDADVGSLRSARSQRRRRYIARSSC
jgi:hypothetical protein